MPDLDQLKLLFAARPTPPRRTPFDPAQVYSWRQWALGAWLGMVGLYALELAALAAVDPEGSLGAIAIGPAVLAAGLHALPFRDRQCAPLRAGRVIARRLSATVGALAGICISLAAVLVSGPAFPAAVIGAVLCLQMILFCWAIRWGIQLAHRWAPHTATS